MFFGQSDLNFLKNEFKRRILGVIGAFLTMFS